MATLAEKRSTAVVILEPVEWRDVYLCSHRTLTDIRCQYGEVNTSPEPATYGRFQFPPQPVAQFALS